MSLRARLALAFLLLAVLPLLGSTLYSYVTTERAFRKAVEAEAAGLAEDLSGRVELVTNDLGKRLQKVGELPFGVLTADHSPHAGEREMLLADLRTSMGPAAALVESLEFVPAPASGAATRPAPQPADVPAPPAAPRHAPVAAPPQPPKVMTADGPAFVFVPEPPEPGDATPEARRWVLHSRQLEKKAEALQRDIERRVRVLERTSEEQVRPAAAEAERRQRIAEAQKAIEVLTREAVAAAMEVARQAQQTAEAERAQAGRDAARAARDRGLSAADRERLRALGEELRAGVEQARRTRVDAGRAPAPEPPEMAPPAPEVPAVSPPEAATGTIAPAGRDRTPAPAALPAAAGAGRPQSGAGVEAAKTVVREVVRAAAQGASDAARGFHFRFGKEFGYTVKRGDATLGTVKAQLRSQEILAGVLARTKRQRGEIPFAFDAEGRLVAADADLASLRQLKVERSAEPRARQGSRDWVVVTRADPVTGVTLGIARPVGDALRDIRVTALRNLLLGLALVGAALVGILPLSHRLTRDLGTLTEGAERLAKGDLLARVPVRSSDEMGRLAATFNRMAEDLKANQERLLEQERLRKELEMGRRIQEEMLPHDRLRMPFAEVKGVSIPAREVGGDFFNYFQLSEGETALVVGDVSGKGVAAALLMANVQATLRARLPLERDLASLALHLDEEIDATTPTTVYLTCFLGVLGVLESGHRVLRYVNAGHNSPLVLRADGGVEPLDPTGRPLGLMPGGGFEEKSITFGEGDSLFLYTDGLVETEDPTGDPFGQERLQALLVKERASGLDGILARVEQTVREFRGEHEAEDDATLVVLKVGGPGLA